ncbi:hypothetical protein Lalb_Chr22g0357921 [Lupinus albus]|uniref:Uncharacterized protein n=1 Tax=Lupinus albus TaxID=3870 RepID=A0A6A4NGU1_LUPAL|nr:hypothetical protein Lalb_Chr22g0357921 [Lupinus albus]
MISLTISPIRNDFDEEKMRKGRECGVSVAELQGFVAVFQNTYNSAHNTYI